jgi:HK97 family phage major capsid protein/HK97 family phage prohead protease
MPMKPRKDETQSEFTSRCVPEMMGDGKRDQDQAVAICLDIWRDKALKEPPAFADPDPDETYDEFMERCLETEGEDAREFCEVAWEDAKSNRPSGMRTRNKEASMATKDAIDDVAPPSDDESYDDFMDRCMEATDWDDDACNLLWGETTGDDMSGNTEESLRGIKHKKEVVAMLKAKHEQEEELAMGGIKHKTHAGILNGTEFVLSDDTPDRMGDIIEAHGWVLDEFNKNPIALFGHKADFPIGKWIGVGTKGNQLRGHLELAPKGTSPRIDEIRALVKAGILRAVSVGFKPVDYVPIDAKQPFGGMRYSKQELVECSLVAVPANPNALSVAKSLNISDDTQRLVFAKHGNGSVVPKRKVVSGELAKRTLVGKSNNMTPLTQRIADTQSRITALRTALGDHLSSVDDSNVTDEQINQTSEINNKIAQEERALSMLLESEKHIVTVTAHAAGDMQTRTSIVPIPGNNSARPFAVPAKKLDPVELIIRAGTIAMFAHIHKRNLDDVRKEIYGDDEPTKVFSQWAQRAAVNPAMTTVTGWAAELVQQVVTSFMETLMPKSVFPRLSGYGLGLSFGRNGRIIIPTRSRTPTIAGSFVGEGQPIPVRQGAFTSQTLTPKKMAVITTWTREIDEHSIPAIEGLLRQAIQEDTAVALDSVLLDANPATVVRPAGILNGVTPLTPTTGGGFNALIGDIKQLSGALITGTAGHLRQPVWLMNPQQVNSILLTAMPGMAAFPFRDEVSRGQLQGWPIIDSGTVPLGEVIAMDAADYVSVTGDGPRFEMSDQATLHEEDTTPLPIVPGSGTASAPVRSLWQTDSLALRLIMPLNWLIRRPGVVAMVTGVTW